MKNQHNISQKKWKPILGKNNRNFSKQKKNWKFIKIPIERKVEKQKCIMMHTKWRTPLAKYKMVVINMFGIQQMKLMPLS